MARSADEAAEAPPRAQRRSRWRWYEPQGLAGSQPENLSAGRRLWLNVQRYLGFGVMRVSAPLRKIPSEGAVQARARLQRARITERYFYDQEISQNADRRMGKAPTGRIELILPHDGNEYFSRQARSDIEHAQQPDDGAATEALIGHLVLTGAERANLDGLLDLGPTRGSVPIRVPVPERPDPGEPDPLVADRSVCVVSHDYQPDYRHFKVDPVDVDAQLHDLDDAQFSPLNMEGNFDGKRLRIMRQVGFRPELRLHVTVRLAIPRALVEGARAEGAKAWVRQVFINWPTHTSLNSLNLWVGGKPHRLRYNPKREGLEWSDIEMTLEEDPGAGEIRTYTSPRMVLQIPQPGELYRQPSLDGQVKVALNRLLSGLDARLYDVTGSLSRQPRVTQQSMVTTKFELILGDAFARRMLSPHQQLHFDEVIPAETRIDDITMALKNLGFKVNDPWSEHGPERRWLLAERSEGPDTLQIVLYVEGKQYKSRRERRVPGGMTYRTDLDSGELRIYAYGWMARESRPVVREMNALRETLRERFDRLPARR
jgi:hypothetical protein